MSSFSTAAPRVPTRFFYGWLIVAIAFFGSFINAGTNGYVFGQFIKPLTETFGWSVTLVSSITLVRSLTQIIVVPFIGRIADRIGSRPVLLVGALAAGSCFVSLSLLNEPNVFYVIYAVALSAAYSMVGGIPSQAAVTRWFRRRRGFALALTSVGISAGGVVMVPVVQWLLSSQGWRFTFGAIGIGIIALMFPLVFFFMRDTPEAMGLTPDGEVAPPAASSPTPALADDRTWNSREVLRHPSFWKQALGYMFAFAMLQTLQLFQFPHIVQQGFDGNLAAFMVSIYAFFAGSSKFVWGYWADRHDVRKLAVCGIWLAGIGIIILGYANSLTGLYLYAAVAGIGIGGLAALQGMVTASTFGRKSYGTVVGLLNPMNSIASGIAVPFVGYLFDWQKSYTLGFTVIVTLALLTSLSLLTLPKSLPA